MPIVVSAIAKATVPATSPSSTAFTGFAWYRVTSECRSGAASASTTRAEKVDRRRRTLQHREQAGAGRSGKPRRVGEPLQSFMTNPAGSAIVNAVGPIRQVVQGADQMQRRYLVIVPRTAKDHGAALQIQNG
jgi:hypothetical protein